MKPSSLARGLETIEAAYEALHELRDEHRLRRAQFTAEYRQIDDQGALLVGAMRSAQAGEGLAVFESESKQKLEVLRAAVAANELLEGQRFEQLERELKSALRARVVRQASLPNKPVLRVMLRSLPDNRRILHIERLRADDAVIAFFTITGKLPSRYGFLFDDSTDDVASSPPWLYADEGVTNTKPTPTELKGVLEALPEVWPAKGMVPVWLTGDGHLARWLQRGAVMEAEVADGDRFRNLLTPDEAERMLGGLLALKLEGRLQLELLLG